MNEKQENRTQKIVRQLLKEKEEKQYEPPYYSVKDRMEYYKDRPNSNSDIPKSILNKIEKELIGKLLNKRLVYRISGYILRNQVDIDFCLGANGARYLYTPVNEIWIEQFLTPPDFCATLVHEFTESHHMFTDKQNNSYDECHEKANHAEMSIRKLIVTNFDEK